MKRAFKVWLFIIVGFFLSWAHVVGIAGNASQSQSALPAASQDTPVVQIPEPKHDFGEAAEGSEVIHDFKIVNSGKAELKIEQVRPG